MPIYEKWLLGISLRCEVNALFCGNTEQYKTPYDDETHLGNTIPMQPI